MKFLLLMSMYNMTGYDIRYNNRPLCVMSQDATVEFTDRFEGEFEAIQ